LLRWLPLLVLVGSVACSVLLINVVMTHVVERQMGARHEAARALPEVARATQVARADPR
jgi:DNA-binding transcriptional regulator YdaS (Cro superfamily)